MAKHSQLDLLTPRQKEILKWLIKSIEADELSEEFGVLFGNDRGNLMGYSGGDKPPDLSRGVLSALERAGFLVCRRQFSKSGIEAARHCSVTGTALTALKAKDREQSGERAMPYQATVVKVMIASPSDVPQERQIIRNAIRIWNAVNTEDRRIVLMPVEWETHSSPDMRDRAQAVINKQLLLDADLLVAVFWTRLGSPTGEAQSGTVEEIEEHLAAGKPAMIYFSDAPVRMDSVDDEQYKALKEFREALRSRGLVEEFGDLTEFQEKFSRQLAQTIIRNFSEGSEVDRVPTLLNVSAPSLTESAKELLVSAAENQDGTIVMLPSINGESVQVGGREFVERGNARSEAMWRAAVHELLELGLIEDRGGKGELFFITNRGYQAVDIHAGG